MPEWIEGVEWVDAAELAEHLGVTERTARNRIAASATIKRVAERTGKTGTRKIVLVRRSAFPVDPVSDSVPREAESLRNGEDGNPETRQGETIYFNVPRSPIEATRTTDARQPYIVEPSNTESEIIRAKDETIAALRAELERATLREKEHLRLIDQAHQLARNEQQLRALLPPGDQPDLVAEKKTAYHGGNVSSAKLTISV